MTTLNEPRSPTRIPFPTVDEIAQIGRAHV